jgi:hypothetical protein
MKTPRSIRKFFTRLALLAALILAVAWLISHISPGGGGSGWVGIPSSNSPAPQGSGTDSTKAVQIEIHGDQYLIDGQSQSIDQVLAAAKAAPGVKIVTGSDSRVGAQNDLQKALDNAHIAWTLESNPATQP